MACEQNPNVTIHRTLLTDIVRTAMWQSSRLKGSVYANVEQEEALGRRHLGLEELAEDGA